MRHVALVLVLSGVSGFAALGCNRDKDKGEKKYQAPGAAFLSPDKLLSAHGLAQLSEDDIQDEIQDTEQLYLNSPSDSDDEGDSDVECAAMNDGIVIRAKGDTMSMALNLDLNSCPGTATIGDSAASSARMLLFMSYRCEGADLSAADGKAMDDIAKLGVLEACALSPATEELTNMEFHIAGSAEGVSIDMSMQSTKSAPDGKGCRTERKDGVASVSTCQHVERSHTKIGGLYTSDETTLKTVTLVGVTYENSDARFYSAGKADIRINDWTGTATYQGPTTAVPWTMNSGSQATSGELAAAPDVALNSGRSLMQEFKNHLRRK